MHHKRSQLAIIACLALWGISVHAAIPVSWNGTGTITFDTQPTIADGWSTLSVPGSPDSITTVEALQTAAITNSAAFINQPLGISATYPPAGNALARWNYNTTNGYFIQTRATGNAYTILLCTLSNATGAAVFNMHVMYEMGAIVASNSTINEHIDGHLAFWSLTGNPNDWQIVPQFSTGSPGLYSASLIDVWEPDALLYLMWVDDNGPSGDTPPIREGGYTIDNFAVFLGGDPPSVTIAPMQSTVLQCSTLSLRAFAFGGIPPYKYQWYRNLVALTNATNNFLVLSNVQASDAGEYFVTLTDSTPVSPDFAVSMPSTVTVIPQTNATVLLSATCSTNLQTITATFNQPVTISSPTGADFRIQSIYGDVIQFVPLLSGVVTNGTNVILTTATLLHPYLEHYLFVPGTGVRGCFGDSPTNSVSITRKMVLVDLADGRQWRYWDQGTDPGLDWLGNASLLWQTGYAPFDGKLPFPRTFITTTNNMQVAVRTLLNITNANYTTSNIPSYYFRASFFWPISPSSLTALELTTFWDDGAILYLNGQEAFRLRMTNSAEFGTYSGWSAPTPYANFEGPFSLPVTNLVAGVNELGVLLKQATSGSSDITMGLVLVASLRGDYPPDRHWLTITKNHDGTITITWVPSQGILQETSSLPMQNTSCWACDRFNNVNNPAGAGPGSASDIWTDSGNQTNGAPRPHSGQKFFRIRL